MDDRQDSGRFLPGHSLGGRPSRYTNEMAEIAYEVMSRGLSKMAAAGVIGVSRDTFRQWEIDHPRFSARVKMGEAARTLSLEQDLLEAPDGPTVTSRIFALKNAAPDEWRDRKEVDHQSSDGSMTPKGGETALDRINSKLDGIAVKAAAGTGSGGSDGG